MIVLTPRIVLLCSSLLALNTIALHSLLLLSRSYDMLDGGTNTVVRFPIRTVRDPTRLHEAIV